MKKLILILNFALVVSITSLYALPMYPAVTSVTPVTAAGTYGIGSVIEIDITFDTIVRVTGNPILNLNTVSNSIATYTSGTGSNTLRFRYTVVDGDASPDLDYAATTSLNPNGGAITNFDFMAYDANPVLVAPGTDGLGNDVNDIIIDAKKPNIISVSANADDTYFEGEDVVFTVVFDENVIISSVTGLPQFQLETGAVDRYAIATAATANTNHTFTYTVGSGDVSSDLFYKTVNTIIPNGGSIVDENGNLANLALPDSSSANSLYKLSDVVIDAIGPKVTKVTSTKSNGAYRKDSIIDILVIFNDAVTVTGTPKLTLETGTTDTEATYQTAAPNDTLVFRYTVAATDQSTDLEYVSSTPFNLNGGTMKDNVGNNIDFSIPSPGASGSLSKNKNFVIDNTTATVTSIKATSADGTYKIADQVYINVYFSEKVYVTGRPILEVLSDVSGTEIDSAYYTTGNGKNVLTFKYIVKETDNATDLSVSNVALKTIYQDTILDVAGNGINFSLTAANVSNGLDDLSTIGLDGIRAKVTDIRANPTTGTKNEGDIIDIDVTFDDNIFITGTPKLQLETGKVDRYAYYSTVASDVITFKYEVVAGDETNLLHYKTIKSLTSGAIKDINGNLVNSTLIDSAGGNTAALANNSTIIVDAIVPKVKKVTSNKKNGTYRKDTIIDIFVIFDDIVTIGGTPNATLNLETGSTTTVANYVALGRDSDTVQFRYTVAALDASLDLDYETTTPLVLGTTTIKDLHQNDVNITFPTPGTTGSLSRNKDIIIDQTAPIVDSIMASSSNGFYKIGDRVYVDVYFSEPVYVTGKPILELYSDVTGTEVDTAYYYSGNGRDIIRFRYIVKENDNSADLSINSNNALIVVGSDAIVDKAANSANLDLTTIRGASKCLSDLSDIKLDGVKPSITSIAANPTDQVYNANAAVTVNINVVFNDVVKVVGTPKMQLETGRIDRYANYFSGSNSNTLVFKYAMQVGDETDLLYYKTLNSISSGSITDVNGNPSILTLQDSTGSNANALTKSNIVIDGIAPKIKKVTSNKKNGAYRKDTIIDILVIFDDDVTVAGAVAGTSPTLLLETGTTDTPAKYLSGSGTDTIIFRYTVAATDVSLDLDYASTTPINLGATTIRDVHGNNANLNFALPGQSGSLSRNKDIVIDQTVPIIDSVSALSADGTYKIGDRIYIDVYFSEKVYVTGKPILEIMSDVSGNEVDTATYYTGNGKNKLTFRYSIKETDDASDLNYASNTALKTVYQDTILDIAGNGANLSLATATSNTKSLASLSAIVIDGERPVINSISGTSATYKPADNIDLTVAFSDAVYVTGTPKIKLETGRTDRYANYLSGHGTANLVFRYAVQSGDYTEKLYYKGVNALSSGSIKDANQNVVNLTLQDSTGGNANALSNSFIAVDGITPSIKKVTSLKKNGAYRKDTVIDILVVFNDNVTLSGAVVGTTPTLLLETGTTDTPAKYQSGSGNDTLVFRYTVAATDIATDLDYVDKNSLILGATTLKDTSLNNVNITLPVPGQAGSLSRNRDFVIDQTAPIVDSIKAYSDNGTYAIGDQVFINVYFSEKVYVTGKPILEVLSDETNTVLDTAYYYAGSGKDVLTFRYTIVESDIALDLDYASTSALKTVLSDAILDIAGNNANLSLLAIDGASKGLADLSDIVIDGIKPKVNNVKANPLTGVYNQGDVIAIDVQFDGIIKVTGTPKLLLETGRNDRYAYYNIGTGTNTLTFKYTVMEGDESDDLHYKSIKALTGGTIRDTASNLANLILPDSADATGLSLVETSSVIVDAIVPYVTKVTSANSNGYLVETNTIDIAVIFSEDIVITGTPTLKLELGSGDRAINYASGLSTGNTVYFQYTVASGDETIDLDYFDINALTATIEDTHNNVATTTLPTPGGRNSLSRNKNFYVDANPPSIDYVTSTNANGTYNTGDDVFIKVFFTENIKVTGKPTLVMETGTVDQIATYHSGSKSNAIVFKYTVKTGDATSDLNYKHIDSLLVNGGVITDYAGNIADTTLPAVAGANSLAANKAIVISGAKSATLANFTTTEIIESVENADFDFAIYPNPVSESINLYFNSVEEKIAISIFNTAGAQVYYNNTIVNKFHTIENNFEDGIYLINVIYNGNRYTERIVISK